MEQKYSHVLSPIKINNVILRNRFICTPSNPHFVQATEKWPTEALITHYGNKAKAGAAVVTCKGNNPVKTTDVHSQSLDITNGAHQHMFAQVAEAVHYYGAKASYLVLPDMNIVRGYDASDGVLSEFVAGDGSKREYGKAAPRELLYQMIEAYGEEARLAKSLGFDMCYIHMAYRLMFPGRFLSPLSNKRTDEFGGSLENMARFPMLICKKIKEMCGRDFLVEISISGREDDMFPGGLRVEDTIEMMKYLENYVDIIQIRGGSIDPSQPTYLDPREIPHLDTASAIRNGLKAQGTKMLVNVVGGCHDIVRDDEIIAAGQADLIGAARAFIADNEFVTKAYENRVEDVRPCLRCNKCHIPGPEKWNTVCSVNPVFGIEHKAERLITPPKKKKKIAVIGGGPCGMEAVLRLCERGHDVTLYEKGPALGGMLWSMDKMDLKWTINRYRKWKEAQVMKSGARVLLNTEATPEMIDAAGYDEVLVAVGASPIRPRIPGADGRNVMFAADAANREAELGKKLVIIGGGEIGVEVGIHLARQGHEVMVVEMQGILSPESVPVHFRSLFEKTWEEQEGFDYVLNATCTGIYEDHVTYRDKDGAEHRLEADNVLLAAGLRANSDIALPFYTGKARTWMIGSCDTPGSIQAVNRSAYGVSVNI